MSVFVNRVLLCFFLCVEKPIVGMGKYPKEKTEQLVKYYLKANDQCFFLQEYFA